jgi:adenine-specific DNA-methyltransferase
MKKLKLHSPDLTQANVEKLAALFPSCVTEAKDEKGHLKRSIDFDLLRQELSGEIVEGTQERYQLNWPGKREALLTANAPIAKTLRPCREESVDFDTTKNLFIEGDNLDALKLLQETYLNKVKLIYIDPPYNTGKDFVYSDDYSVDTNTYLRNSNQLDQEGARLVLNSESNGRFHSDWLSMIYPRLKLARTLLREDGIALISIDDSEMANLMELCFEVFGNTNFVATLIWEKGRKNDAKLVSVGHEYMLVFAKNKMFLTANKVRWREAKPGAQDILDKYIDLRKKFAGNHSLIEEGIKDFYASLPKSHPAKKHVRYNKVDAKGIWRDDNMSWPGGGGPSYDVIHPITNMPCAVPQGGWRYSTPETMQEKIRSGKVVFRNDHTEPPIRKTYLVELEEDYFQPEDELLVDDESEELAIQVAGSYFYRSALQASNDLSQLFNAKVFNNPKDKAVIARWISYTGAANDDIVLDFFAGSGTTGHAVFQLNADHGTNTRFILIQLPEVIDPKAKGTKPALAFLAEKGLPSLVSELTKERLRRSGKSVKEDTNTKDGTRKLDVGFRVLRVDTSNMKEVYYSPDTISQDLLSEQVSNIREDRSSEDLLFQVLLDWGVDLTLPITQETIDGKLVLFVDGNALAACFDEGINEAFVKLLAKRTPLRAVFRDAGFESDSVKINVNEIFKLMSPSTEVKVI